MTPLTLDEKLTQLQLMSAPAALAAWGAQHPAEHARVREVLAQLVDQELARRSEQKVAARIKAARFVQLQTAETFNFEYSPATRKLRSRYLNLLATDVVTEGIGALFVGGSGLGKTHLARALGVRAVSARAERPVHLAGGDGEPPECGGGDEDVTSGAQDLPEPGAAPDRRSGVRQSPPAGEPPGVPGNLRPP